MKTENKTWQNKLVAVEIFDGWAINDSLGNRVASKIDIGPDMGERAAAHIVHCVNSHESLKAELSSKEALIGELKGALEQANLIICATEFKDGNIHKMVRTALNKVK